MKCLIAASALCLSDCALPSSSSPAVQRVQIDGQTYPLSRPTNSTWITTASGIGRPMALSASSRGALLDAIASASGCKVTDSDDSRQGLQLDAQVDCCSRLNHMAGFSPAARAAVNQIADQVLFTFTLVPQKTLRAVRNTLQNQRRH
jgi:hypothetical protein